MLEVYAYNTSVVKMFFEDLIYASTIPNIIHVILLVFGLKFIFESVAYKGTLYETTVLQLME